MQQCWLSPAANQECCCHGKVVPCDQSYPTIAEMTTACPCLEGDPGGLCSESSLRNCNILISPSGVCPFPPLEQSLYPGGKGRGVGTPCTPSPSSDPKSSPIPATQPSSPEVSSWGFPGPAWYVSQVFQGWAARQPGGLSGGLRLLQRVPGVLSSSLGLQRVWGYGGGTNGEGCLGTPDTQMPEGHCSHSQTPNRYDEKFAGSSHKTTGHPTPFIRVF